MDRLALLLQYHADDPTDAFTRFAIANEYRKRGDLAQAAAFFEQLVADDPGYTGTYYHLGKLYEEQGRPEAALATYQRGIQVARDARAQRDLAELQDALLSAQGIGWDD